MELSSSHSIFFFPSPVLHRVIDIFAMIRVDLFDMNRYGTRHRSHNNLGVNVLIIVNYVTIMNGKCLPLL